ncbi:MAG: class II aldolase/adducin family protein [Anaerolineales bacterium]|nr:class II aldolase/adducin family protein [Anaerolineales bacterium]
MILEGLRVEVLASANALRDYGLVWMAGGTICARDPETGYVVVTPSGLDYALLSAEDMIVVDMDLNIISGKYRPSVATNLWTAILRARPDVNGIVHSHSPYATAFSVVDMTIPIITETQADWFGQPIKIAPYTHIEDDHFITAPVEALGDGFGVMLGQHGPITVGENLHHAMERAVTLEEAAKTYFIARGIGEVKVFTPAQAKASFEYYQNRYGQR